MISMAQRREIANQIGVANIMALSGGRIHAVEDGIELPISNGYKVRIILDATDTYTVSRVFTRSGAEFIHGSVSGVYCNDVAELAYRAGMFRSYTATQWMIR